MQNKKNISRIIIAISILILLQSATIATVVAINTNTIKGFDKGPSYTNVVPIKKLTFVNFDSESYLDDYAYLAAVPTAVFNEDNILYSNPLLFYEDKYPIGEENKERSLNTHQGIEYFMQDWMGYCNGKMDKMILINVPKSKLDSSWTANDCTIIQNENIYKIASELAFSEWSYSDEAVIAVVKDEFENDFEKFTEEITGTISGGKDIKTEKILTPKLNKIDPRYSYFTVPDGYTYLKSKTIWAAFEIGPGKDSAMPVNINLVIPAADPDVQLYCKYDEEWMMASITSAWNINGVDKENSETYVYNHGDWRLGITDVPTKGIFENFIRKYGTSAEIFRSLFKGVQFETNITMFPGIDVDLQTCPPFGCRDVTFKLTWDDTSAKLGFCLIGPAGEEILSATDEESDSQEIHLDQLGECYDNLNYKLSVFRMNKGNHPVNFKIEYSWDQNLTKEQADSLTSATEGAVLASALNAPLLYIEPSKLTKETEEALYKLGVKKIHVIDLNSHLSDSVQNSLEGVAEKVIYHNNLDEVYKIIMDMTGQNDIIFTTIDPWTRWLVYERKPYDETKSALFIGPAAYIAAHHGSPVIVIDNHPELSSAVVFHNEYWKRNADGYNDVTVAPMHITGTEVYRFLAEHDFDREGEETMITVADQFEFGAPWDRTFVGKAKPGRIYGSPVDTAYWISRCIFYPALIFENPGMSQDGVTLMQGSYSKRSIIPWSKLGLKIYKDQQEEKFTYPVLQLYVCYEHNLNDAFSKYYGFKYKTATDIVPGETASFDDIDTGMVPGNAGAVWPDISTTEVIPKYLEKGGYDSVFSTSFQANIDNLNDGILMWITSTHGDSANGGYLLTWDPPESSYSNYLPGIISNRLAYTKQENPWRAYDWYLGSTDNPDTLTMEVHGILAGILGDPEMQGLLPTGIEIASSVKPIRQTFFKILSYVPVLKRIVINNPWLADQSYYKDGCVIPHSISVYATSFTQLTAINLDDNIENVHCCGWINTACLPAYKYLHLTMVRHGSPFQVIDPWPTSWYGSWWAQTITRDLILGDTIGEAYMKGIQHVGVQYVSDDLEFWWDVSNNVCLFGDPDLRPFVPSNSYSTKNTWEQKDVKALSYDESFNVDGHTPFGATNYPKERQPISFLEQYYLLIIAVIIVIVAVVLIIRKKKK